MPKEIVTETKRDELLGRAKKLGSKANTQPCGIEIERCPAPEFNLGKKDVKLFFPKDIGTM